MTFAIYDCKCYYIVFYEFAIYECGMAESYFTNFTNVIILYFTNLLFTNLLFTNVEWLSHILHFDVFIMHFIRDEWLLHIVYYFVCIMHLIHSR